MTTGAESGTGGGESLLLRLVEGEVAGKNQAIHSYDKMVWTVRSGSLTLIFAGWGLFLSSLGGATADARDSLPTDLLAAMIVISVGLALAGFIVDVSYVRRKFRVIAALDALMELLTEAEDRSRGGVIDYERLAPLLKIAGDTDSTSYRSVSGYASAFRTSMIVYLVPVVVVVAASALLLPGET